jgi:phosphonate transport system substrate-binding protein
VVGYAGAKDKRSGRKRVLSVTAIAGRAAMARHNIFIASVFASLILSAGLASAQECPRGDLDKAYCDRDGDMVADTPTDPKQLVTPSTLIFAYTPVEDPAVYTKVWDGFLKHIEKVTGKKVVFFPVQSNAAEIEAMRSGRLHIAGFNTGSNPIAVNCAGFVPFAIMAGKDGAFGYEMEIIVPADSTIKTSADIKGKKLTFTAQRLRAGVLRQARQLDTWHSQQGLRRGGDSERSDVPHVRAQRRRQI